MTETWTPSGELGEAFDKNVKFFFHAEKLFHFCQVFQERTNPGYRQEAETTMCRSGE